MDSTTSKCAPICTIGDDDGYCIWQTVIGNKRVCAPPQGLTGNEYERARLERIAKLRRATT